ncbi:MAG: ROK family protein [Phaeodactylibacter sp.]|nr:ROK family protein [Phaeodactylibacter sp.]
MTVLIESILSTVALGVDIGGTSTKLSLVDPAGTILQRSTLPTKAAMGTDYPTLLVDAVQKILQYAPSPIKGIGVGAPGCDPVSGYISYAVNLPFSAPFPIRDFLSQKLCAHTVLVKDSTAAALGEKMWGGAQKMDNFLLVAMGTGLGSAFYINGKIVSGGRGLASELGHTTAVPNGRKCTCGKRGCLETYVSATGLRRTCQELMGQEIIPSALRELPQSALTAKTIALAAKEGDPLAQMAMESLSRTLGQSLSSVVLQLDPEGIFLSGGLSNAGSMLAERVAHHMNENLLPAFRNKVPVMVSQLGADTAGTLGAAAQVYMGPPA